MAPKPTSLPLINLSPFLPGSPADQPARQSCAAAIHQACSTYGFLFINGLGSVVSADEMAESLRVSKAFFDRPAEEKQLLTIKDGDGARGYQVLGQNVTQYKADWHEGLDLYRPVSPEDPSQLLRGPNQWPTEPASFRPTLEAWIAKMHTIGLALMEATALGLGLTEAEWLHLRAQVSEPFWVMRCIGYPSLPADAAGISCGAHRDYGCWTLLHADQTEGALQVFLVDEVDGDSVEGGKRGYWISADPVRDSFVVNIGEMWEIWSARLYRSTLHRVIHRGPNYRVSIPFFFEPNFDALIEPIPSAVKLAQERGISQGEDEPPIRCTVYGEFLKGKVSGNFGPPPSAQA